MGKKKKKKKTKNEGPEETGRRGTQKLISKPAKHESSYTFVVSNFPFSCTKNIPEVMGYYC